MLPTMGSLFDPSYFRENKQEVARSAYDIIRDHLGYRLYIERDSSAAKRRGS